MLACTTTLLQPAGRGGPRFWELTHPHLLLPSPRAAFFPQLPILLFLLLLQHDLCQQPLHLPRFACLVNLPTPFCHQLLHVAFTCLFVQICQPARIERAPEEVSNPILSRFGVCTFRLCLNYLNLLFICIYCTPIHMDLFEIKF